VSLYETEKRAWMRDYWRRALTEAGGVAQAARAKGLNRSHLHTILKNIGVSGPAPRRSGSWGDL